MFAEIFLSVSLSFSLPPNLLSSLCYVESNHRAGVVVKEKDGSKSIGICQIKLSTARDLGFKGTKKDLLKPENNIYYAGLYLSKQYKRYKNWARAVNAYNRGFSESNNGSEYVNKVFNRMLQTSNN